MRTFLDSYFPRFTTRRYIVRVTEKGSLVVGKYTPSVLLQQGDTVHEVRFFNFFGTPLFIKKSETLVR